MTVVSESLNGKAKADTALAEMRVRRLLADWGMGSSAIGDVVAMLRRHGGVGPSYLVSAKGADRVNAAWSGDDLTADDVICEADSLDALADELSGASARGDDLSDDVLAAVLADLSPRKASPDALFRKLTFALKGDVTLALSRQDDRWRILVSIPESMDRREGLLLARDAIVAALVVPGAIPAREATTGQPGPLPEGRGEMGNVGDATILRMAAAHLVKHWDAMEKLLASPRPDPLLVDVNRILKSAGCTPMPEGELLSGPMPTSTPAAGFPPTRPEPDPPCPHKAVVPGTGAEICPGCGGRVAEPPPTVGRLKRVLLTVDEVGTIRCRDEAEIDAFRERAGLPRGTIMMEPEFDDARHCYVATVECQEWPEVLLGDEVPFHPRHGR